MAEESPSTTPPSTTPPSTSPPTPKPGGEGGGGIMDKLKAGASALKDKVGQNIDEIDSQMKDKLDEGGEKKKEEKDEDFVKSIMAMLRGLTEEVNLFRDELKEKGKEQLQKLGENEKVQKGLAGLKDVASDVASMAKGMLSKGPSPKAKKDDSEEGIEMEDRSAKKDKGASDDVALSKGASSASLKEVAMKVLSSLSDLSKGIKEVFGSSSPSATASKEAEKTQELDSSGPKMK